MNDRVPVTRILDNPRFQRQVAVGSAVITALVVASVWGRWSTIAALLLLHAVRVALIVIGQRAYLDTGRAAASANVHSAVHVGFNLVIGYLCHFTLPVLLYIPFHFLITQSYHLCSPWAAALPLLLAIPASLAGVPPITVASFAAFGAIVWGISTARAALLDETLGSLVTKHQELGEAHERLRTIQATMIAHEKLAGLGVLAAGIAHEINNPMSFVTGNVTALAADLRSLPEDAELLREYADDIVPATIEGIARVNTIVADLRRFARREVEALVEYDLNVEVAAAVRLSQSQTAHRCRVELDLRDVPWCLGRPQQIVQFLVNLIVNAVEASPADGVVAISTRAEGTEIVLRVADRGVGMTAETQGNLFQPFFTTKPVGAGIGLGLSVVHGVVASHGGSIAVDSELGRGSTFTVRLPIPVAVSSSARDARAIA